MKKILVILVAFILITGCGKGAEPDNKSLDLTKIKTNLSNLVIKDENYFDKEDGINNLDLLSSYSLDISLYDEYLISFPTEGIDPSMYIIVKPIKDTAVVKYQIDDMFEAYYNSYNAYYPEGAKLIKDRLEKTYGDYLIYIVSHDNDKVYNTIVK